MTFSVQVEEPLPPPISTVTIVLSLKDAVELQRTITSVHSNPVRDRLYIGLTETFKKFNIKGGLYV